MDRPLSPEEWEALTPRQKRVMMSLKLTQAQFAERMAAYTANVIKTVEINSRIAPMLAVGGKEWKGDHGQHRVYFDIFRIPRYDHSRGVIEGYYDVTTNRFVSSGFQNLSDDQFTAFIVPVIAAGGDLPADAEVTFDINGSRIDTGDECMIIVPRDETHRGMDIRANAGRIVIASARIRNWPRLFSHWIVTPENPSIPLVADGKHFLCEQSSFIVRSTSLMRVGPEKRKNQAPSDISPAFTS